MAFVKDHCIFDNIIMVVETMDWTTNNNQELLLFLLNFKKAYDKIL